MTRKKNRDEVEPDEQVVAEEMARVEDQAIAEEDLSLALAAARAEAEELRAKLAKVQPAPIRHVRELRTQLPDAERAANYSKRLVADQLKLTPPGPEKKTVAQLTEENAAMAERMAKLEALVAADGRTT